MLYKSSYATNFARDTENTILQPKWQVTKYMPERIKHLEVRDHTCRAHIVFFQQTATVPTGLKNNKSFQCIYMYVHMTWPCTTQHRNGVVMHKAQYCTTVHHYRY